MAIQGTVTMTGVIAPTSTGDTYAVTDAKYGYDSLRNVSSNAERNAITTDRRRQGMIVGVDSSGSTTTLYYTLLPAPWTGTDSDWVAFSSVGGSGATSSASTITYTNLSSTPTTVGGIAAGSTFSAQTIQQMFDSLLYPYQLPGFSSFSLGISTPQEIGFDIAPAETFTWSTSNSTNISSNTIQISGDNLITLTGLANDGSEPVTFTAPVTRGSADGPGTRDWTIQATNTHAGNFTGNLSIRWDYKMYAGTSTNTTLTEAQIEALTDFSSVKNGFSGTFSMAAGGYKYFCFANTYGTPTSFKDASNGFNVAMTTDSVNYPNTDGSGNRYALVSVTNANSETTNYRVYRTQFILGGTISIVIA